VGLTGLATAATGVGAFAAWNGGVLGYRTAGLTTVVVATLGLALTMRVVTRPDIEGEST
jgi:hypothetical protein